VAGTSWFLQGYTESSGFLPHPFSGAQPLTLARPTFSVSVLDLNGDGRDDMLVPIHGEEGGIGTVWTNNCEEV
jgi:hypothetical protein